MKRIFTFALTMLVTTSMAEGYQVNLQSARQAGMAHTGTAQKLGAESMHFNPAALVFMKDNVDLSIGVSGVSANAKYEDAKGNTAKSNNGISTPMYVYAGFSIFKDRLAAGLSVNNPYGSSMEWGENWVGADVIQKISLRSFVFQPTVSVKIARGLSFGAGLMVATGKFSLSRAMLPAGILSVLNPGMFPADKFGNVIPASATLSSSAKTAIGYNLGLYYDVCDKLSLGVSYRSKMRMKVTEGDAVINYASPAIQNVLNAMPTFPQLDKGTFKAELPLPSNFNLGITVRPTDRWTIAYDMQFVGWKAYDKLNVKFTENVINGYSINADKNYKNTITYRLGAQYVATERLNVRLGGYYDETPVRSNNYNPETPGANKMGLTAGCSFTPYKNLYVDLAFTFIKGFERSGTYKYDNGLKQPSVFAGKYRSAAYMPSLGIRYSF